jgi:predicted RNase H-like HicB family nuclease
MRLHGIFSGRGVYVIRTLAFCFNRVKALRNQLTSKGPIMSTSRTTFALLALAAALAAASAQAQTGKTREEVRAELAEAIRTGNVIANGESGLTLRELFPQRYPAIASAPGLTRAQVIGEFEEARRTGDLMAGGESGLRLNELYPQAYPTKFAGLGKTREQVKAELAEAIRTGNIMASGEAGGLLKDLYPQRYANVIPAANGPLQARSPSGEDMR